MGTNTIRRLIQRSCPGQVCATPSVRMVWSCLYSEVVAVNLQRSVAKSLTTQATAAAFRPPKKHHKSIREMAGTLEVANSTVLSQKPQDSRGQIGIWCSEKKEK